MAFYQLEPFGTEVDMLGHAITSATIANANRSESDRAYEPSDFMPNFEEESHPKTIDDLMGFVRQITNVVNKKNGKLS
jgi:hypothetical protein